MRKSNELQIGKAGEYLVCADLIMMGFIAYPSEQGLPYDIVVDTGKKLLRCQVKTTQAPRVVPQRAKETKAYIFNVKKHGKGNLQRYGKNEVDFFALCELENRSVGYLQTDDLPETINIRADHLRGTYYDEKGAITRATARELFEVHGNRAMVAKEMGTSMNTVHKYLNPKHCLFETGARYWSDFKREKEWFLAL